MKKLLAAMLVSCLVLSGCGLFNSNTAWKNAKQENPLQIPPPLDRPSTTAAVTIPPPANANAQETGTASAPAQSQVHTVNATELELAGNVDTVYRRVGLALQGGDLGSVTASDNRAHSYELSVAHQPTTAPSSGFLKKHFSNLQQPSGQGAPTITAKHAGVVTIKVIPGPHGDSLVMATGDPQQAAHVISVLTDRLAG